MRSRRAGAIRGLALLLFLVGSLRAGEGVAERIALRVPYGTAEGELAGPAQDPAGRTDGFPPAYDVTADGRIHVLDGARGRVVRFDARGRFEGVVPLGPAEGHSLADLSVAPDGRFAVTDLDAAGVWIFPARLGKAPVFRGPYDGIEAIRLDGDGRLWLQREDEVLVLGPSGAIERGLVAAGLRPWSAGRWLYGLGLAEDEDRMEIYRVDASDGSFAVFAALRSPLAGAVPVGGDLIGVGPDGALVAAVLVERSAAGAEPAHGRLDVRKFAVVFDGAGRVARSFPLRQANVSCRVTPRFHRVGADGKLYTARPGKRAWVLIRHDLPAVGR